MTYFRVSRGFKAGGINPTAPSPEATVPFKSERLLAYELGFKSQWLDNRLRINADGFYRDYHDLREALFYPSATGGNFRVTGNVDKAEIWGMEFEGTALLLRGLEVTANYSFVAPKYLTWNETV
jgi:iron complex outermembrane receptor protein